MLRKLLFSHFLVLSFAVAPASAVEVLYGANGGSGNLSANLYILNPANGAVVTTVGPIGFAVTGLAVHPTTGVLYGSTGRESSPAHRLITINKATGQGTLVGSFNIGEESDDTMADLTFTSDGTLYGWSEPSAGGLSTVNKATGQATLVGAAGLVGTAGSGLAANSSNTLYYAGSNDNGPLRTINRFTGQATTGPTLNGVEETRINALAFNSANALYGSTRSGKLIAINTATGGVTVLGPTVANIDAIVFDNIQPAPPIAAVAVPTLSEWAFVALALLLVGVAAYQRRRRDRRI